MIRESYINIRHIVTDRCNQYFSMFTVSQYYCIMASGELSLTSNSSQEFDCFQTERPRDAVTDSPKDFESAKQQYDQSIIELNSLRLQHSDSKRRMDHIMEQLEFYREQYMAAMNQVEQSAQEGHDLRTKYTDISNENVRLQQRNHHLEKKVGRMLNDSIKQEKEIGNCHSVCTFAEQCNDWKKKFEASLLEMDKLRKETDMCKKVCDDLSRDRNSLALEKDGLKQQLSSSLREKNMYRDDIKEMNQVMQDRADEMRRVTAQRNAAEHELRTILAERKGVLEENQKLSDDLTGAKEELDKQFKEVKKHAYENDGLKREIESVLRYKDDLMKECSNLREKLEEATKKADNRDILKSRESGWSKDLSAESQDKFGLSEQHVLDIESANQEVEKLRKNLERAVAEIDKSALETEVAKSRRDWAISEREKIVLERDSVKILCDELRKERDTAISDLLATIRDSEKIKEQKDIACRELEQIREQMDSQCEPLRNIRWSCNPYEMEMLQKNDTEIVELDVSQSTVDSSSGDLGIVLEGGREDSQNRIDCGIVVVSVVSDSVAYGKLRPGDCIMQVNNRDCTSVSKRLVLEAIRTGGPRCSIIVKRQRVNKSHMYAVRLSMAGGNRNHGITLETGVFITKITPGSLAAREDDLVAGDRVLSINSKTMEGVKSAKDAMAYLDDNRTDSLTIISLKQVAQTETAAVPPPPVSRTKHNKMINICTQTDDRVLVDMEPNNRNFASGNSKSTSKISEMINKFKGKMHIPGHHSSSSQKGGGGSTVSDSDSLCQEKDAIEVLDSVLNNENSSGKSKDNLFKRSKRLKKDSSNSKEANKNLGTWPRANVLLSTTQDSSHSGTIVQQRKKERPALSFFTGPISLGKDDKSGSLSKKDNYYKSGSNGTTTANISGAGSSVSTKPTNVNRNSNPIPFHILYPPVGRHSYSIENELVQLESVKSVQVPMPMGVSTLSRNQKMPEKSHAYYQAKHLNRLSLNIPTSAESSHMYNTLTSSTTARTKSPIAYNMEPKLSAASGSSAQQNSLDHIPLKNSIDSFLNPKSTMSSMDFKRNSMQSPQQLKDLISLKSQNSIDSFLLPKSPMDLPMKQSVQPRGDSFDMYTMRDPHPSRMGRNVSKYPSDSDSLGMDPASTPPTTIATALHNSNYPNYAMQSRVPIPSSRSQRAHPMYLHPHPHSIRQTSPLTLPVTQLPDASGAGVNSTDKLEFDCPIPHHQHGASMDVDLFSGGRTKPIPVRDRETIYGSSYYGHAYEGGTFPRKKENQRFRIPSNPSVTSKGSGVKNSTGSIEHGSERGSPMPPAFQVEVLSHGANKRNSMPDYCYGQKPSPGDLRRVTIDKSVELGITITCNTGGGIFVTTVAENSIASQVSSIYFQFTTLVQ